MGIEWGPPFGDGMVLQRRVGGLKARLWGWSEPGRRFRVEVAGTGASVRTSARGRWRLALSLNAGGPFELTVDGETRFRDVWVGDVWLCSGQSNMERSLAQGAPWPADLKPWEDGGSLRQLCVTAACDFVSPRRTVEARWIGADSHDIGQFSAVAFAFARRLRERTGVPQGMVLAAAGGSSAQAWLSARALRRFPAHLARARWLAQDGNLAGLQASEASRRDAWYRSVDARDPKNALLAGRGEWRPVTLPSMTPEFADRVGTLWLRRQFSLSQPFSGESRLTLGTLVEADDVWLNGVWVGSTGYQYPTRRYAVPPGVLKAQNELLIRLVVPRGGGRITPGKPLKLWGGPEVDLSGPWQWREGAQAEVLPDDTFLPKEPLGLHNGVLCPLAGTAVRAVLWYQGESNTEHPSDYQALQKAVVAGFRRLWRRRLPFVAVQLPLFGRPGEATGWAEIRDAQRRVLELPRTALVVALDQGEWNELHPADKEEIGSRLALAARHLVLRDKLVWSGPLFAGCQKKGDTLTLFFTQTGTGLSTSDGKEPEAFFVDGKDGIRKVRVRIVGATVMLKDAADTKAVYYAWADNPEGANLVNDEGLPMAPFKAALPRAKGATL